MDWKFHSFGCMFVWQHVMTKQLHGDSMETSPDMTISPIFRKNGNSGRGGNNGELISMHSVPFANVGCSRNVTV